MRPLDKDLIWFNFMINIFHSRKYISKCRLPPMCWDEIYSWDYVWDNLSKFFFRKYYSDLVCVECFVQIFYMDIVKLILAHSLFHYGKSDSNYSQLIGAKPIKRGINGRNVYAYHFVFNSDTSSPKIGQCCSLLDKQRTTPVTPIWDQQKGWLTLRSRNRSRAYATMASRWLTLE